MPTETLTAQDLTFLITTQKECQQAEQQAAQAAQAAQQAKDAHVASIGALQFVVRHLTKEYELAKTDSIHPETGVITRGAANG